jgi:hypothetical protein
VKRLVKILAMIMLLAAVLVLSLTGTVFAANGPSGNGNQGEECPYGDGDNQDCEPKAYSCNNSYEYNSPGPHGQKNMVQNGSLTQAGSGAQNQCQKGRTAE